MDAIWKRRRKCERRYEFSLLCCARDWVCKRLNQPEPADLLIRFSCDDCGSKLLHQVVVAHVNSTRGRTSSGTRAQRAKICFVSERPHGCLVSWVSNVCGSAKCSTAGVSIHCVKVVSIGTADREINFALNSLGIAAVSPAALHMLLLRSHWRPPHFMTTVKT